MALLTILEFPDPRLRTRAAPVQEFDAALSRLVDDMLETMYAAPGIGLAATQVDVHRASSSSTSARRTTSRRCSSIREILAREGVEQ